MAQNPVLDFDVDDLTLDVFELADSGLVVESLTAGHGMLENAASSGCGAAFCSGSYASCTSCVSCGGGSSCNTCCGGGGSVPF